MNRRQFMQQLSQLLMDLPNEERFDALKYYNNYFDDAGEENEDQIIEELGSPQAVAAVIKADTQISENNGQNMMLNGQIAAQNGQSVQVQQEKQNSGNHQNVQSNISGSTNTNDKKKKWSTGTKIGIVILCILASPMIITLGCASLGIAVALVAIAAFVIVAIFSVFVALSASGIGCALGGLGMFGIGIYRCLSNVANGLVISGSGFIITAAGILLLLCLCLHGQKQHRPFADGLGAVVRNYFQGGEKHEENNKNRFVCRCRFWRCWYCTWNQRYGYGCFTASDV